MKISEHTWHETLKKKKHKIKQFENKNEIYLNNIFFTSKKVRMNFRYSRKQIKNCSVSIMQSCIYSFQIQVEITLFVFTHSKKSLLGYRNWFVGVFKYKSDQPKDPFNLKHLFWWGFTAKNVLRETNTYVFTYLYLKHFWDTFMLYYN